MVVGSPQRRSVPEGQAMESAMANAADVIRAAVPALEELNVQPSSLQLHLQLHEELPYASAVETEKYSEREDGSLEIHQQILVARPTQRAIVLGKGGARIKAIGEAARLELAKLMGVKVHLYLHVKVHAKWDEDRSLYRDIGLEWVE